MNEAEFAYIDGEIKGNSRVAISYLEAVKDVVLEGEIREIAFKYDNFSGVLLKNPIPIFVRVKGDIPDAKVHARKILKKLGFAKRDDLDNVLKFAEEIDKMPVEEVLRMGMEKENEKIE